MINNKTANVLMVQSDPYDFSLYVLSENCSLDPWCAPIHDSMQSTLESYVF